MIDSVYLDWAIGLAVVFFLGGALISGLNEGLNWITRVRAKFLWAYLYDLFNGHGKPSALPSGWLGIARLWGTSLARRVPFLRKLGWVARLDERDKRPLVGAAITSDDDAQEWVNRLAGSLDPILAKQLFGNRTALKHVPPTSLAQALVEAFADVGREALTETVSTLLRKDATETEVAVAAAWLKQYLQLNADPAGMVTKFRRDRREADADAVADLLQSSAPADGMREAWRDAARNWDAVDYKPDVDAIVAAIVSAHPAVSERARIEHALAGLAPSSPVTKTLRRLWAAAEGKVDAFRTDLERYLDADLQRLSGYYRRSIRVVMLVLAAGVALIGGIDAVAFGQNTWRNASARDALIQRADEIANSEADDADGTVLQSLRTRCGADTPITDVQTNQFNTKIEADQALADVRDCVNDSIDELTGANVLGNALWNDPGGWANEWTSRPLSHGIGTILAALALMLGAPFWFDVIRRLTGIRKPRTSDA